MNTWFQMAGPPGSYRSHFIFPFIFHETADGTSGLMKEKGDRQTKKQKTKTIFRRCHMRHRCHEKHPSLLEHAVEDGRLRQQPNMQMIRESPRSFNH